MLVRTLICTVSIITMIPATSSVGGQQNQSVAVTAPESEVTFDKFGCPVEAEPALSLKQAEQWRDELIPHVEAVAGRTFKSTPVIRVVTRKQLLEAWERDLRAAAKVVGGDADKSEVDLAIMMQIIDDLTRVGYLGGRYSTFDAAIDLPAGNYVPLLQLAEVDPSQLSNFCKIMIAHELAHALHEQHLPFVDRQWPMTPDMSLAFEATNEGFATFVQNQVAKRLNLSALNTQFEQAWSSIGAVNATSQVALKEHKEKYIAGAAFMQHHFDSGGIERIWKILADPPMTYVQIAQPHRYGETVAMRLVPEKLFEGLDEHFGIPGARPMIMTVDAESAVARMMKSAPEEAAALRPLVMNAHTIILNAGVSMRAVTCYEIVDADSAMKAVAILGAATEKHFDNAATIMPETVKIERLPAVTMNTDSGNTGYIRRMRLTDQASPDVIIEMLFAGSACGSAVIQLVVTGPEFNDELIASTIDLLCQRLTTGEAMQPIEQVDDANELVQVLKRVESFFPETKWRTDQKPLQKQGVEMWLSDDVAGQIALEMGYLDGAAIILEATEDPRATRRLLALFLVQCETDEAAQMLGNAIGRNMSKYISSNMPVTNIGDITTTDLDNGITVHRVAATVSAMGQTGPIVTVAAHHRNHVLWWFELNDAVGDDRVEEFATLILSK